MAFIEDIEFFFDVGVGIDVKECLFNIDGCEVKTVSGLLDETSIDENEMVTLKPSLQIPRDDSIKDGDFVTIDGVNFRVHSPFRDGRLTSMLLEIVA